jgi:hypothetical protein
MCPEKTRTLGRKLKLRYMVDYLHSSSDPLAGLIKALAEAGLILRRYGEVYISDALADLEMRLCKGDLTAIQSALIEATGGMGSLNDRIISVANGDHVDERDEVIANKQLRRAVQAVRDEAQALIE